MGRRQSRPERLRRVNRVKFFKEGIDFTEKCRDELPSDAGNSDFPFDDSETLQEMQKDWELNAAADDAEN